jgi:aspartate/methionine/tyrosine aminotransferase
MHALADELNEEIRKQSPDVLALLSARGRALYMPRGIILQSQEAKQKAHRINATIGVATEGPFPMSLPSVRARLGSLSPAEALDYSPTAGKPELRQAWREKLLAENPTLRGKTFGLPIVTSAITHGLSLAGDLFVDPGDRLLLPDKVWDNYPLNFEVRLGAQIESFPTYAKGGFNVDGLRRALLAGPEKQIVLLNFPNNPTGYMPTRAEVEGMRDAIVAAAESGRRILAIVDDAYFGLTYDEGALAESPIGFLAQIHPRVLALKLDAGTKEVFVWGLRCGFLSFVPPPVESAERLLAALERKALGAIRAVVSSSPTISQQIVLDALRSPTLAAERREKFEILRARALRVAELARRPRYRESWDVYPFNAGYFMCIAVKGVDAERLRRHLLEAYGIGVIALGQDVRVAFSSVDERDLEALFEGIHEAIGELRGS